MLGEDAEAVAGDVGVGEMVIGRDRGVGSDEAVETWAEAGSGVRSSGWE